MFINYLTILVISITCVSAQLFDFFQHFGGEQQQQQQQFNFQDTYLDANCDKFLCQDTLICVDSYLDCPCPFPASELKCLLPDNKNYICISKPANAETNIYDDPIKGPKVTGGDNIRDCGWVTKAFKGQI